MVRRTLAITAAAALLAMPASAQVSALRFVPEKVPVGACVPVPEIEPRRLAPRPRHLYVADDRSPGVAQVGRRGRVGDVRRWPRPGLDALLGPALRIVRPSPVQGSLLKATLETDGEGAVSISVLPGPPRPYHAVALAQLRLRLRQPGGDPSPRGSTPRRSSRFGRADFLQEEGRCRFVEMGEVHLRYEGRERRGERRRPGVIGSRARASRTRTGRCGRTPPEGHLVEFELPIPDEPGFTDGRLRLLGVERKTPAEWETFKRSRLGE